MAKFSGVNKRTDSVIKLILVIITEERKELNLYATAARCTCCCLMACSVLSELIQLISSCNPRTESHM